MTGQMSIYDFLPEFNPVENLAHKLVWDSGMTPTRNRLMGYLKDNELTADKVRREYCPFGASGYIVPKKPWKIHEYHMQPGKIEVSWTEENGKAKQRNITWTELTDAIRKELEDGQSES